MKKSLIVVVAFLLAMSSFVPLATGAAPDGEAITGPDPTAFTGQSTSSDGDALRAQVSDLLVEPLTREPQFVFGNDDRVQVSPADPRVAWIITYYNSLAEAFVCTATFIGPDTLLTASHCVYDTENGGGFANIVDVFPGIDGVGGDGSPYGQSTTPYGWIEASDWFVPTAWIDSGGDFAYDYALITLSEDFGEQTGWLSVGDLSDTSLDADDIWASTIGYPSDKTEGTQWSVSVPALDYYDEIFFESQIDQVQGQSGSSIYRQSDEVIFGIVSFEYTLLGGEYNASRRINDDVMGFMNEVCGDVGCSFDTHEEGSPPGPQQPGPGQPDTSAFDRTWAYTDQPVIEGDVARTWMWGPEPFIGQTTEPYQDTPGGERIVRYYDKSRMEITNPSGNSDVIWYITNGLLAQEMIEGEIQTGNDSFDTSPSPANVNVAGDPGYADAPTYASFSGLTDPAAVFTGREVTDRIDRDGNVTQDPSLANQNVTMTHYDEITGHNIAGPFWDFMNSEGPVYENGQLINADLFIDPFYATGRPITEPYFADVSILGTILPVLMQCFERRCLTYTPTNPPGFQVEAGNVGLHYHCWRYGELPAGKGQCTAQGEPDPTPDPPSEPDPEPDPPAPDDGILYESDLTDWASFTSPLGDSGAPSGQGYVITNQEDSFLQRLTDQSFGDASFSVRTRVLQPAPVGLNCVIARANPDPDVSGILNTAAYHFCGAYEENDEGQDQFVSTHALYESTGGTIAELGAWDLAQPVPAGNWLELEIVADGSSLSFLADGNQVGSVPHGGVAEGRAGFASWNFTDLDGLDSELAGKLSAVDKRFDPSADLQQAGTSQSEFTDLIVRELD